MGERSASDTLAQAFLALIQRGTIRQAEFAREIDVEARTLRRRLLDMQAAGMPLTREEEHPNVFWSVPKGWLPGGIAVSSAEALDTIRFLLRAPHTSTRDRLLERFLQRAGVGASIRSMDVVVSATIDDEQDRLVRVFEDALAASEVVTMRFLSRTRGQIEDRSVSIHRLLFTDPARFIATCHRDGQLKWFRLDNVQRAHRDSNVRFRSAEDEDVDRFVEETKFGFHERGTRAEHAFIVRAPEHRWVGSQLGPRVDSEPTVDGVRYTIATASVTPLARFVVSLGGAARVETPELALAVRELALGALGTTEGGDEGAS